MRFSHNHTLAAQAVTDTMPFAGMGFDMAEIRVAATALTPRFAVPLGEPGPVLVDTGVPQLCGYKLLVTLGREIRGR